MFKPLKNIYILKLKESIFKGPQSALKNQKVLNLKVVEKKNETKILFLRDITKCILTHQRFSSSGKWYFLV